MHNYSRLENMEKIMTLVTVTRRTNRYRRAVNGLWLAGESETTTIENVPEEDLAGFSLDDGLTVAWPDGHKETAFPSRGGQNDPPDVPPGGRLAALFVNRRTSY